MTPADRAARASRGLYWDRAWSLVEGCEAVSPGCARCWSAAATHMRAQQKHPPEALRKRYEGLTIAGRWTGRVRFMREALRIPASVRAPTRFAIWNDLFHAGVSDADQCAAFDVMIENPRHTYLVLTKRAENMRRFMEMQRPGPALAWLGVTAEDQERADERIPHLLATPAAVRYVSVEPMLGPVDLRRRLVHRPLGDGGHDLDWVVIGCESGPLRRPCSIEWVRDLVRECEEADVAVWVKQLSINGKVSADMTEWPEDLRIRQLPGGVR